MINRFYNIRGDHLGYDNRYYPTHTGPWLFLAVLKAELAAI
jgi:hypothetical protein